VEIPSPEVMIRTVRALPGGTLALSRIGAAPPVHLVGGAARDLLLGKPPRELDLVVEGDTDAVAERFAGARRAHVRFGTSTVTVDGLRLDLARARRETYAHPGALPDVAPADVETDLRRRDFTVNAIAIALNGPEPGRITSVAHALADLGAEQLRVLHDASFRDDPTRLLRLARYAARLGFAVEPRTRALVDAALADGALGTVSGTRIGNELRLLGAEPDPVRTLGVLAEYGIAAALTPPLAAPAAETAQRALVLLPDEGRRDLLVLALALPPGDDHDVAAALDRWGFEAADRTVLLDCRRAGDLAATLARATRPSEIAASVRTTGPEAVALAGALGPPEAAEAARAWLTDLRHVRLEISGADLLGAGIAAGPPVGAGLRGALAAKLDGRTHGPEDELHEALRVAAATG
jgi:tRNA nucleotidyltransferase (CCA-adding enzyme)